MGQNVDRSYVGMAGKFLRLARGSTPPIFHTPSTSGSEEGVVELGYVDLAAGIQYSIFNTQASPRFAV